ncbi:MAG: DsbE family thiol:disulfide interchange protein [Geminicoccaceae bacterium]|nr:DsbE family thiol:disulfide interchange protein [Geminicoccaceae bacterium]
MKKHLLYVVPVIVFVAIAAFLAVGLTRDPQKLPSALLDKPVPAFSLPPLAGRAGDAPVDTLGLSDEDLGKGEVTLVNVFASWCVPCRVEHPLITELAEEGVTVHGINYKDAPADAVGWLERLGDPYARIGADENGRAGIEWGVYGVPETFIVDQKGTIVFKQVGPIQERDLEETIRPILEHLRS